VFRSLPSLTDRQQVDVRALVGFAKRVCDASLAERQAMVLAHGFFPPSVSSRLGPSPASDYTPWTTMLERWAVDFLDVVERVSSAGTLRVLGIRSSRRRAAP